MVVATAPDSLIAPAARSSSGRSRTSGSDAVETAGFLVGGGREQDVARQAGDRIRCRVPAGGPRLRRQEPHDHELHRDEVLHVDRAPAPDLAVGEVRGERVVGPLLGRSGHDVEVGEEEQRLTAGPVAAEPGGHRAAAREGLVDLGRDAGIAERLGDPAGRPQLPVRRMDRWRVDRRNPDQVAKRLDELVARPRPGRRRRARRRGAASTSCLQPAPFMTLAMIPSTKPPMMIAATMMSSRRR